MALGLGEVTARVHDLLRVGDVADAHELLDDALGDIDPSPSKASPELAEAAGLLARVLLALGEANGARNWAAFAYAAAKRLHGPDHEATIAVAATLAAVLHRVGSHARSLHLYADVVNGLTALDGPESARALAAHADLATVEYARGECGAARNRIEDAWEIHREVYGEGDPAGIRMLARLGAMQRDCGRAAEAESTLALARELCREHLSPEDPLAALVGAIAAARAGPEHVCDEGVPSTLSAPPPGAIPPPAAPVSPAGRPSTPSGQPAVRAEEFAPQAGESVPAADAAPPAGEPAPPAGEPGPPAGEPEPPAGQPEPPAGEPEPPAGESAPRREEPGPPDVPPLVPPPPLPSSSVPTPRIPSPRVPADQGHVAPSGSGTLDDDLLIDEEFLDPDEPWWPPGLAEPFGGEDHDQPAGSEDHDQPAGSEDHDQPAGSEDHGRPAGGPGPEPAPPPFGLGGDPGRSFAPTDDHLARPFGPIGHQPERPSGPSGPQRGGPADQRIDPYLPPWRHDGDVPPPSGDPDLPSRPGEPSPDRQPPTNLPVAVYHPPRRPIRQLVPVIVAGLVVVLLGAVAVIAGFALSNRGGSGEAPRTPDRAGATVATASPVPETTRATGPTTPAPTKPTAVLPPAPARPGTPPSGVTLRDDRGSVTLAWTYPAGAGAPVVVSGGRRGQQPRAFEQLPSGAANYVVYGLDEQVDYCFTIAVVYSPTVVGRATPVCTGRAVASPGG